MSKKDSQSSLNSDMNFSTQLSEDAVLASKFFKLFMQNQKKIYTYILMLIPNRVDAEDVLQETATLMWIKFVDFVPGTNFASWGIKIAHFKALRYWRTKKNHCLKFTDKLLEIIADEASLIAAQKDSRLDSLEVCLEKLNPADKSLIKMRYEQDLPPKKIAEAVSRPVQGIYKTLTRIHNVLLICIRRRTAMEDAL